jgi:hypothetical protein
MACARSYDVSTEDLPRVAAIVKSEMEGALPFLKVLPYASYAPVHVCDYRDRQSKYKALFLIALVLFCRCLSR